MLASVGRTLHWQESDFDQPPNLNHSLRPFIVSSVPYGPSVSILKKCSSIHKLFFKSMKGPLSQKEILDFPLVQSFQGTIYGDAFK